MVLASSTWELLANEPEGERGHRLTFSTPNDAPGEVHVLGAPVTAVGLARSSAPLDEGADTVLVLEPTTATCWVRLGGPIAHAYSEEQDPSIGGSR